MTNSSQTLHAPSAAPPTGRSLPRLYFLQAKYEFLKLLRLPMFVLPTLSFPLMFYLLFGTLYGSGSVGGVRVAAYMLATYGVFGVIAAALFGFGVGVASERGQGWMRFTRATPMPPLAYFTAKVAMSLLFSLLIVLLLSLAGVLVGGVRLPPETWLSLVGVLLLGALPFCALGLAVGYLLGPNSAPVAINLVYLPMAFASGLWQPIEMLPDFVQELAPFLPAYHYAQLALGRLGASQGESPWLHALVLLGFTAASLVVAVWAYKRDEGRTYG